MNLKKRIKYYLVGASIGILLSVFIFNGRGCEWLPGARVLKTIRSSKIIASEFQQCLLNCKGVKDSAIYNLIENGSVDFGKSDAKNKNYYIADASHSIKVQIIKKDTTAIITSENTNCNCASLSKENYNIIYQPNTIVLEKLKALTLSIKKEVECELNCFGILEEDIPFLFENGEILFEDSYPNRVPNPIYYITLNLKNKPLLFWVEQGATKTRIKHVINYQPSNLEAGEPLSTLFEQSMRLKDCNCY